MSRKVEVKFKLELQVNEDMRVADVLNELDYSFVDTTTAADVLDSSMIDFEIVDSK